ncbi:hypothetical protein CB1_000953003 [Camelus ferus]|nr:hypothetical protein CB1_000953003 [Camelus ferus]
MPRAPGDDVATGPSGVPLGRLLDDQLWHSVLFEHTQQHVNLTVDRHSRKFRARRGLSHLDLDPKVRSFLAVGTVVDEGAVVQGRDGPMERALPTRVQVGPDTALDCDLSCEVRQDRGFVDKLCFAIGSGSGFGGLVGKAILMVNCDRDHLNCDDQDNYVHHVHCLQGEGVTGQLMSLDFQGHCSAILQGFQPT